MKWLQWRCCSPTVHLIGWSWFVQSSAKFYWKSLKTVSRWFHVTNHLARQVILEEKTNRYIKMDQLICVHVNMNDCWEALCCSVEFNITPGSGLLDLIPSRHQSLWNWSTANELMSVMSSWIIKWSVSLMIGLTSLWSFQQLLYQQKTKTQRCVRLFIARHNPSSSH